MSFGKLVTWGMTRFGFCSRKAAIRLASQTGKKLAEQSAKLGRDLTTDEVQVLFKQTLPKKLRPKIITSVDKATKDFTQRTKMPEDFVYNAVANPAVKGMACMGGRTKTPIFIKSDNSFAFGGGIDRSSVIAHELEHALEYNNRPVKIFERKILDPLRMLFIKDKGNYYKNLNELNFDFQVAIQANPVSNYSQIIKDLTQGSKTKTKMLKKIMDVEIPGYTTGANVEKYVKSLGLKEVGLVIDPVTHKGKEILIPKALTEANGKNLTLYQQAMLALKNI